MTGHDPPEYPLAEDNAINQQLAVELLTSQGVVVDVADNGQMVVDKLMAAHPATYHAVLMDLQMPVMDGYEATRQIRQDERFKLLPIIAMTAHAMAEERERCLALGMSAHVSKPFEPDDLYATLARFGRDLRANATMTEQQPAPGSTATMLPPITGLDSAVGLRRCGGNQALYFKLLGGFVRDYAQAQATFQQLLASQFWQDGERMAHTLKGLAGSLGASAVQATAQELEAAFKNSAPETGQDAVVPALTELTRILEPLLAAIRAHLPEPEPCAEEQATDQDHELGAAPDCLPALQQLLSQSDGDSIELWAAEKQAFSRFLPVQVVMQINSALDNFDFDRALALLDAAGVTHKR
jgi:CheY-like chemotaxis protein